MHTRRTARTLILIAVLAALVVEDHVGAQGPEPRACSQQALGPAVVDVPSVTVQPRFRLNGRAFPGAGAGVAAFTLWASEPSDAFDGPQLVLGETHLPRRSGPSGTWRLRRLLFLDQRLRRSTQPAHTSAATCDPRSRPPAHD